MALRFLTAAAVFSVASALPPPSSHAGGDTALARITAHADGFLRDAQGRVRIFRGFNDIQRSKAKGHKPGGVDYLPKALVHDFVLDGLEEQGFNAMRVPMMWAAAHPFENVTDFTYLENVSRVVDSMGQRHIYSLFDMHQDVLSSRLSDPQGDTGYDGAPRWLVDKTELSPTEQYPAPWKAPLKQWGEGYLTKATGKCFQDIYDNVHGGLDDWARFWRDVAGAFKNQTAVLGYELINEPWVGDQFRYPLLMLPGEAGSQSLSKVYSTLTQSIREVDRETPIFFEPVTWGMIFAGKVVGTGFKKAPDANSVLTYHYYCWFADGKNDSKPFTPFLRAICDSKTAGLGPDVFRAVAKDSEKLKVPTFLSEWGGKTPSRSNANSLATQEILRVLDLADEHFTSWTFYDICVLLGSNYSAPWGEKVWDALAVFARPYAQAIAGVPTRMKNGRTVVDGQLQGTQFVLEFDVPAVNEDSRDHAKVMDDVPTEVVVPPLWFPQGYTVAVSAGLRWEMAAARKNVVAVWNTGKAAKGVVTITAAVAGSADLLSLV
eukprot:TRINITY_DN28981_c0_g1_i1.p1 TRINITY_DN28981_c0_g1~~TRINITY_DN28981_c0_g1_i1.p1  ORF type:complete len:546 (-),score=87.58 TRINITY_DN28981_c0_g1_i1:284-1921(-)